MFLDQEEDINVGQLVITIKDIYGLEEKWFTDSTFSSKTIVYDDNILIPKHTVGMITGFINNWAATAAVICWGDVLRGKKLVITLNKAMLLDRFIERLDNE